MIFRSNTCKLYYEKGKKNRTTKFDSGLNCLPLSGQLFYCLEFFASNGQYV